MQAIVVLGGLVIMAGSLIVEVVSKGGSATLIAVLFGIGVTIAGCLNLGKPRN